MNETRRKPTTGRQPLPLLEKWHGSCYMPSRIGTAVHTKAFDYRVAEHWGGGEPKWSAPRGFEPTTHRLTVERATNWAMPAPPKLRSQGFHKAVKDGRLCLENNKKCSTDGKPNFPDFCIIVFLSRDQGIVNTAGKTILLINSLPLGSQLCMLTPRTEARFNKTTIIFTDFGNHHW